MSELTVGGMRLDETEARAIVEDYCGGVPLSGYPYYDVRTERSGPRHPWVSTSAEN